MKSVIILSTKGSGSTAVMRYLTTAAEMRTVEWTRHHQRETLYWTKAASMLGLWQHRLVDSEVPLPAAQARDELVEFIERNVPRFEIPADDRMLIFAGWRALCRRLGPVFVEKSPHHLPQLSALQLIARAIEELPEITFRIIGLVRNPVDVVYSQWRRWKANPQETQFEWHRAYTNLQHCRAIFGNRLLEVRYEDLATGAGQAARLQSFLGCPLVDTGSPPLESRFIQQWRSDSCFDFQLDDRVRQLANAFGYSEEQLSE